MSDKDDKILEAARTLFDALDVAQKKQLVRQWTAAQLASAEDPRIHRQKYRKREEMPDPSAPADFKVNVTTVLATAKLKPKTKQKLENAAEKHGLSVSASLEIIINELL